MRYTITSQQFDFLKKEGFITFEGFLSPDEAAELEKLLKKGDATGRDLERDNRELFTALKPSRLGQAAGQLFNQKRIRIAFTQYQIPFEGEESLEEISSVTELIGGALIHLTGDVTFYQKAFPIAFGSLDTPLLLIGFATDRARYKLQEKDPHTHLLKKLGYGFGDALSEQTHPFIRK